MDTFWSTAKQLTNEIHALLQYEKVIKKLHMFDAHEILTKQIPLFDFSISNMGNVDKYFPEDDHHVKLIEIIRSTDSHSLPMPLLHNLHTFRGKLMYNMDCYCNHITADAAERYADHLFDVLREAIELPE